MAPAANRFNFDQSNAAPDISREFPITEPLIVACPHIDGFLTHSEAGTVHFAGWQTIEALSEGIGERRVVIRFAMSDPEARTFRCALGCALRMEH